MIELKPCTCGSRAHWRGSAIGFWVACDSCGASTRSYKYLEYAVGGWNRDMEQAAELDRLKEVEKDSTDLHTIVKQQHEEIRKLKDFVKKVPRIGPAMVDYHCAGTCLEDCLLCEAERLSKECRPKRPSAFRS
jgi:hypothetical protein